MITTKGTKVLMQNSKRYEVGAKLQRFNVITQYTVYVILKATFLSERTSLKRSIAA